MHVRFSPALLCTANISTHYFFFSFFHISFNPPQNLQLQPQLTELDGIEKIKETTPASNGDDRDSALFDSRRRAEIYPVQVAASSNFILSSNTPSWTRELLTRIHAAPSPEQAPSAAGTSTEPLPSTSHTRSPCPDSSTETYSGTTQLDQASILEANSAPVLSWRLRRRARSRSESVPSIVTAPEHNIVPLSGENARQDARERLFKEIQSWPYAPNEDRLREFLVFDGDDAERPFRMPSPADLEQERIMLERTSAKGAAVATGRFRVFDGPEYFEHNRLKCWVYLNQFRHGQRWPEGYMPLCTGEELEPYAKHLVSDDGRSLWSAAASSYSEP